VRLVGYLKCKSITMHGNMNVKFVEKIETCVVYSVFFSLKLLPVMRYVVRYGRVRQATDENVMWRMRIAC
jgi:hypothetical protein